MKSTPAQAWQKLTTAARRAPEDTASLQAPYGFATRVVAQAFAVADRPVAQMIEGLSWRALGISALIMIAVVAINLSPVLNSIDDEVTALTDDEITELASI